VATPPGSTAIKSPNGTADAESDFEQGRQQLLSPPTDGKGASMNANWFDLEEAYQSALAFFPADVSDEQKELIRADLKLQLDFPGEYVVFEDRWERAKGSTRLHRTVLRHHPDVGELQEFLLNHTNRGGVTLRFAAGPDSPQEDFLDPDGN
jgi:hypothetical protein